MFNPAPPHTHTHVDSVTPPVRLNHGPATVYDKTRTRPGAVEQVPTDTPRTRLTELWNSWLTVESLSCDLGLLFTFNDLCYNQHNHQCSY